MKKIKEEITGGEVLTKNQGWGGLGVGSLFEFPKAGETTEQRKTTTYEATAALPYTAKITEVVAPALDVAGNPLPKSSDKIRINVSFPFERGAMKGIVELFVYPPSVDATEQQIAEAIWEAIGRELVELEQLKSQRA